MPRKTLASLALIACVAAQSSESASFTILSSPSPIAVTTAVATPSPSASSLVPSQAPLPPKQAWCPSEIFCAGSLLQTLNVAQPFIDPKTIVDKPTSKNASSVLSDFAKLPTNGSLTESAVVSFIDADFAGEGQELEAVPLPQFVAAPSFLSNVSDPLVKAFAQTVHGFWPQLARGTNASTLCTGGKCESTLIPLNHTFVVPGGRFREQYYWDSFWIVEGLLASQLFEVANSTLQNFMDEIERFGFIPNGGRIYYLNRSQPPLFIQMLARYVDASNDTTILQRALPLAERELVWWQTNRTVSVKSPFTNQTHQMAQYSVTNSAPRPESYFTDYTTATDPTQPVLNDTQREALYAQLASGAETGWDYSSRWLTNVTAGLRSLDVKGIVPVDLNSILYKNRVLMASLYGKTNASAVARHTAAAAAIKAGVLDLCWNATKLAFYDFSLTKNARNDVFSTATFYPFWSGLIPSEVLTNSTNAFGAFASLNLVMNRYNGTMPVTFLQTGQQWDAPNSWPPHQYIALMALRALPANVTGGAVPTPASGQGSFSLVPPGQLGIDESALPMQNFVGTNVNASTSGSAADISTLSGGGVVNGGNATQGGWADTLGMQLANRYMTGVLCSWRATGGSIPGILPRLSDAELNVTQSVGNTGNMFEKLSISDVDSSGSGGEYTVQAGFGWTNGVVLWAASNYGDVLAAPQCPPLLATTTTSTSSSVSASAGGPSATAPGGSAAPSATGGNTGAGVALGVPPLRVVVAMLACVLAGAYL
ncbi:glycoside hydrolase family 37 protein [Roridomyces roridus]|uniref:Trehalase n=1 Tax=Roridomyces roridus TaxID=1738132 RepID=A0AAD7CC47_9AGAR|nr:glycoside hydrolase family 37 protein [Roridomyces roridus]